MIQTRYMQAAARDNRFVESSNATQIHRPAVVWRIFGFKPDERIVCQRPFAQATSGQLDIAGSNETLFVRIRVELNSKV